MSHSPGPGRPVVAPRSGPRPPPSRSTPEETHAGPPSGCSWSTPPQLCAHRAPGRRPWVRRGRRGATSHLGRQNWNARRELHEARVAGEAADRAHGRGVRDVGVGQAQVDRVEDVEHVPAQVGWRGRTGKLLLQAQVEALPVGPAQDVASARCRRCPRARPGRRRVEPLVDRLRSLAVADQVRQARSCSGRRCCCPGSP